MSRDKPELPVSKLPSRLDTSKREAAATAAGAAGDERGLETVVSQALDRYVFFLSYLCFLIKFLSITPRPRTRNKKKRTPQATTL